MITYGKAESAIIGEVIWLVMTLRWFCVGAGQCLSRGPLSMFVGVPSTLRVMQEVKAHFAGCKQIL